MGMLALVAAAVLSCASSAASSSAAAAAQGWQVVSVSNTTVNAGGELQYWLEAINRTRDPSDGSPFSITLTLPQHMTGVSFQDLTFSGYDCGSVAGLTVITCTSSQTAGPDDRKQVIITAAVPEDVPSGLVGRTYAVAMGSVTERA